MSLRSKSFATGIVLSALLLPTVISEGTADALTSKSKPTKPQIETISAVSRGVKGKVHVTVTFARATTHKSSPILLSEVTVGSVKCLAKKSGTRCTAPNVSTTRTVKVTVRAKNKNGFGARSATVAFKPASGATWRRTGTTTTTPTGGGSSTTLPPVQVDLTRSRVIGTSSVKLSKVQGVAGTGVSSARVRAASTANVIFKTSGVVAYAQAETSSQTGSKLLAVSSTGSVSDALVSGSAVVKDFFVAPNGRLYVAFETKAELVTGGTPCLLAEVDSSSGVPTCVDTTLDSINWNLGYNSGMGNSPVQFASNGAIFYTGYSGSSQVLRRSSGGSITDLVNDNIQVSDFIVLSDGTVILAGRTNSTQVSWLRRISPSGGLKNLVVGTIHKIALFADGRVYAGLWGTQDLGWKRYLPESDALENKYWISGNTNAVDRDAYFSLGGQGKNLAFCEGNGQSVNNAFCGWYGTIVYPMMNIGTEKTFGVAGGSAQQRQLWQYYPTVEKANVTNLQSINVAQQVSTRILVAGTTSAGVNSLSVYDTSTRQETVVMDSSNEVEIYSMSYSARNNSVVYSGLRFSDNRFVVGEVPLG